MCFSSECQSPPGYSSRESCPAYSCIPGPTECTLQQSRRRSHVSPTGVCIKRVGGVTLLLLNQEDGNTERPIIGPGKLLSGSVLLESTENIKSVTLKIDGVFESSPLPDSYSSVPIVRITQTLYSSNETSVPSPNSFSFSHRFPSAVRHNGSAHVHALPPTCDISLDNSGHSFKCSYRITVTVVSSRHRRASFLTKSECVSFELNCCRRTRPSQPILSNPSLLDTVKRCPEEWAQCPKVLRSSPHQSLLMCDLFMPALGVFCVAEMIPFHLQLSGPDACLPHMHQFFMRNPSAPNIKVTILRQVEAHTGHRKAIRNIILGDGSLRFLPTSANEDSTGTVHAGTLNWEGEARCRDPASVVGSFDCGFVIVRDMLSVEISSPQGCPLPRSVFGYEIKLTTDSWDEGY
ncbi:hypothetical protein B0H11DRAFT_197761 [Mycena galericulata]|nr:hypothetical protein B0H11DRAFT_197761 [Mycena galericulata]